MSTVKQQVQKLADTLPEDATWEQVRYELHVRQQIEEGERAIAEGRTLSHEEVKKRFRTESPYRPTRTEVTGGRWSAAVVQVWPPSAEAKTSPEVAPK